MHSNGIQDEIGARNFALADPGRADALAKVSKQARTIAKSGELVTIATDQRGRCLVLPGTVEIVGTYDQDATASMIVSDLIAAGARS